MYEYKGNLSVYDFADSATAYDGRTIVAKAYAKDLRNVGGTTHIDLVVCISIWATIEHSPIVGYKGCAERCYMRAKNAQKKIPKTVRRSVALPRHLIEEANAVAPAELGQNLNRLVTVALQEFAARRKALAFEAAMAQMAADPPFRTECASIEKDFRVTEADGLASD